MHVKEYRTRLRQVSLPDGRDRLARAMRLALSHARPGPVADPPRLVDRPTTMEGPAVVEEVGAA